jgi:hypothetical protein
VLPPRRGYAGSLAAYHETVRLEKGDVVGDEVVDQNGLVGRLADADVVGSLSHEALLLERGGVASARGRPGKRHQPHGVPPQATTGESSPVARSSNRAGGGLLGSR